MQASIEFLDLICKIMNGEVKEVWVPFILLGGGYAQMVSPNVWVFAEVLVDVLQDSNSPYENWDPFVSFGAGVGF